MHTLHERVADVTPFPRLSRLHGRQAADGPPPEFPNVCYYSMLIVTGAIPAGVNSQSKAEAAQVGDTHGVDAANLRTEPLDLELGDLALRQASEANTKAGSRRRPSIYSQATIVGPGLGHVFRLKSHSILPEALSCTA